MESYENTIKGDTSFLIKSVEYTEPSEYEKKMISDSNTVDQQLEAEQKEEPVKISDQKIFIDMIKVIALVETGHEPLDNPSNFYDKEKKIIIEHMSKLLDEPLENIKNKFNDICDKKIFIPSADYSTLPIFSR